MLLIALGRSVMASESALTPGFEDMGDGQKLTMSYVGFDHMVMYNLDTHTFDAFDMRRNLGANETCDYFVNPPLIHGAPLHSAMTSVAEVRGTIDGMHMTFLGGEMFLLQNAVSGEYEIRRCSGFMPQQKTLPCEVYNVGCDDAMKGSSRYFYGGVNSRVIRYEQSSNLFQVLFFDSDIPGGSYPFQLVMQSNFMSMTGELEFAVLQVPGHDGNGEILFAADVNTGSFKAWNYDSSAKDIKGLIGKQVMEGQIDKGYHVRSMTENTLLLFHETTGDFETIRITLSTTVDSSSSLVLSSIKRDNIYMGHGCIQHTRGACVTSPGCGWCPDDLTCHQVDNLRKPCDATVYCSSGLVDAYSPDYLKYSEVENPVVEHDFGDEPSESPVSQLRGTDPTQAAVPIQAPLHEDDKLEFGIDVNPEKGTIFTPPSPNANHLMDDIVVKREEIKWPSIGFSEDKMNEATGFEKRHLHTLSPTGHDDALQVPPSPQVEEEQQGQDEALQNVTVGKPCAKSQTKSLLKEETYVPAEVPSTSKANAAALSFGPTEDATQSGHDLMNGVRTYFSALAPKTMNLKSASRDVDESKLVPHDEHEYDGVQFVPPAPHQVLPKLPVKKEAPVQAPNVTNPFLVEESMEDGTKEMRMNSPVSSQQGFAMANAQYKSESIYQPFVPSPFETSAEHRLDFSGKTSLPTLLNDESIPSANDDESNFIEGTAFKDVHVAVAAGKMGVRDDTAPLPSPVDEFTKVKAGTSV